MWILMSENGDDSTEYKLLVGNEYVVGRKDVAITLENDLSISRKHAVIMFTTPSGHSAPRPVLRDSSKFGTSVNGIRLSRKMPERDLEDGDKIKFGVFHNIWRICYRPLTCCTSCLSADEKVVVQELVVKLGGQVLPEWTEQCSLLIMNKLTVTIKVINVLLSLKRVVTPKYFRDLVDTAEKRQQEPDPSKYLPSLEVSGVLDESVDFAPKNARTSLFSGTTFVTFALKQAKKLKPMMKQAGACLKSETASDTLEESLVRDGVCVLQPPQKTVSPAFESKLACFLNTRGRRLIPEGEVGLAVLYCSCSKYCNPMMALERKSAADVSLSSIRDTQTVSQESCLDTQVFAEQASNAEADRQTQMDDTEPFPSPHLTPSAPATVTRTTPESAQLFKSISSVPSNERLSAPVKPPPSPSDMDISKAEEHVNNDEPMESEYQEDTEPYDEDYGGGDSGEESAENRNDKERPNKSIKSETGHEADVKTGVVAERSSLVHVRYESLVRRRRRRGATQSRSIGGNGDVRNFKPFKKVLPKRTTVGSYAWVSSRRPRLEMVQRVTQSQVFSHVEEEDDDRADCTDSAKLFDWP